MNSKIKFSSEEKAFNIGSSCQIKTPKQSLKKGQEVDAKIKLAISRELDPPKGYVQASSTLTCEPLMSFRKHGTVKVSSWFLATTDSDVDVTFFKMNGAWEEIDSSPLTEDGSIETQVKNLGNITAFLPIESLPDVRISLKSYLFKKGKCVKACLGVNDEVYEQLLKTEMSGYDMMKNETEETTFGKTIPYLTTDSKKDEASGQIDFVEINEQFLDLKATPILERTEIVSSVIAEETPTEQPSDSAPESVMIFEGEVDAKNIINNAGYVHINQTRTNSGQIDRPTVDGRPCSATGIQIRNDGQCRSTRHPNQATEHQNRATGLPNTPSMTFTGSGFGGTKSFMNFRGPVKASNIVGHAGTVTIDQREQPIDDTEPPVRRPVEADTDVRNPVQVEGGYGSDNEYQDAAETLSTLYVNN